MGRTIKSGILNRSQFWITDTSISVKRYMLYGQSVSDKLIGIITVSYTKIMTSKINRPCWLKYCQPGFLSVPAPGQSYHTKRLYGKSSRGSGYRVIAMVVSSTPLPAALELSFFKPRKELMSEDFPVPEPPQTAK